jgi:NAD(P)H dehydrogenase (quinone)
MYAVTGITGQVGGATARALIDAGLSVRAVVRDAAKGAAWKKCGCEVALAEMNDAPSLSAAFTGASGVFVLIPSNYDPEPGFPEVRAKTTLAFAMIGHARRFSIASLRGCRALALRDRPRGLDRLSGRAARPHHR